jgi:uncharacterized 2Fe-2S/4Fe-4S cluster protein (DUF4445 family)
MPTKAELEATLKELEERFEALDTERDDLYESNRVLIERNTVLVERLADYERAGLIVPTGTSAEIELKRLLEEARAHIRTIETENTLLTEQVQAMQSVKSITRPIAEIIAKRCINCGQSTRGVDYDQMHKVFICNACGYEWTMKEEKSPFRQR